MFNPEFRYLLIQEERNGDMMPIIDKHIIAAICVCGINAFIIGLIAISAFKVFSYAGVMSKYIWTALWNSLTPGHQWLELAVIVSSIVAAVMMFMAFEGMSNIIDKNFEKIKAEIAKKDERIKELEAKLMETSDLETEKTEKVEEDEITEAKKLEAWFSRQPEY
jgi:hypothetical protein